MGRTGGAPVRPEITAASRGGDPDQLMDGEADLGTASLEQALFWTRVYGEILAMEEKVMERVQELMAAESPTVRREVELTNVPVIASQVERFRQRHQYWDLKVQELHPRDDGGC
ncbi:MAG TPA: hypothetical protein VG245_07545 [Candidatus Dormibacteraeota bacterium]|jgi:hypothetical protein|nr:hypothetical protein [Candidatus Dormibacteraeota bacterium]